MKRKTGELARQFKIKGGVEGAHRELDFERPSDETLKALAEFLELAQQREEEFFQTRNFEFDQASIASIKKAIERAQNTYIQDYARAVKKSQR